MLYFYSVKVCNFEYEMIVSGCILVEKRIETKEEYTSAMKDINDEILELAKSKFPDASFENFALAFTAFNPL